MNEPERTEWQIRCAFNGFCKRALKNESINAHKEIKRRQAREISFSDLTPKEENFKPILCGSLSDTITFSAFVFSFS